MEIIRRLLILLRERHKLVFNKHRLTAHSFFVLFPTWVFPNPKSIFLAIFYLSYMFFQLTNLDNKKKCNCCCIQILLILIRLQLKSGACNGQISTFGLSTIICSYEVRVLLADRRMFVVGSFVFSFK